LHKYSNGSLDIELSIITTKSNSEKVPLWPIHVSDHN